MLKGRKDKKEKKSYFSLFFGAMIATETIFTSGSALP